MKKRLAILAAAVAAVTVPVAHAVSGYWSESGPGYKCQGYSKGVICDDKVSGYSVAILPNYVMIAKGKKHVVYGCKRDYTESCVEG